VSNEIILGFIASHSPFSLSIYQFLHTYLACNILGLSIYHEKINFSSQSYHHKKFDPYLFGSLGFKADVIGSHRLPQVSTKSSSQLFILKIK
jgi:hypothetical protein